MSATRTCLGVHRILQTRGIGGLSTFTPRTGSAPQPDFARLLTMALPPGLASIAFCAPTALGQRFMIEPILLAEGLAKRGEFAQTLGMAIHELATNAGKYGALSNTEGRVAVHWGLERDGGAFTISWREQGGPAVAPPSRNGFGSTVIGRLAESSLDGRVDLEFLRTGLFWRLRCPAAAVIEGTHSSPAPEARI